MDVKDVMLDNEH